MAQMTGDDLAALLRWLYGDADGGRWLGPASADLCIGERNLRAMMAGKLAVPADMVRAVCMSAAAHASLFTWRDRVPALDALPLGADARREVDNWRARVHYCE